VRFGPGDRGQRVAEDLDREVYPLIPLAFGVGVAGARRVRRESVMAVAAIPLDAESLAAGYRTAHDWAAAFARLDGSFGAAAAFVAVAEPGTVTMSS
jgi:hypothetical protein